MSDQDLRRPVLLSIAGIATVGLLLFGYHHYRNSPSNPSPHSSTTSLQRSNAVHRRRDRRRWRAGYIPQALSYNPTQRALSHLEERDHAHAGYGQYWNTYMLGDRPDTENQPDMSLLPSTLDELYSSVLRERSLSVDEERTLLFHIHSMFMQNFLREEFPEGYIIAEDVKYLITALGEVVDEKAIAGATRAFDNGLFPITENWNPQTALYPPESPDMSPQIDGPSEVLSTREYLDALHGRADADDQASDGTWGNEDDEEDGGKHQNMLDLLYHIAGEQARRDGYIHRGVVCNSCGAQPIQGIRYHCANCWDYDLCESCEAGQVHIKNHVFYKIRIPAPKRGHIKLVAPKWYPGNPNAFPATLPPEVSKKLLEDSLMDRTELDALYEQFKCLAGCDWPEDPSGLGMAINRRGFDLYFIPTGTAERPSPPNLIHDRIFAFYDTDRNGLIGFAEYIHGLAHFQIKSRAARLRRIFQGYDIDEDGFVSRKDFLRMFRAYYALSKELNREMIKSQEDYGYIDEEIREVVHGSQPISAAFGGTLLAGHRSRSGEGKTTGANDDLVLNAGQSGVLRDDTELQGDRLRAIGSAALGDRPRSHPFRTFRTEPTSDEPLMHLPMSNNFELLGIQHADDATEEQLNGPDPPLQTYGWPPLLRPDTADIVRALGADIPLEDITDPIDRSRVFYAQSQRLDLESDKHVEQCRDDAVKKRWRRRQFYLDQEEGMTQPQGYKEQDSSDDEDNDELDDAVLSKPASHASQSPRRHSIRSRSSSKVRFDDSAIDTDHESRSNASSKNVPVNERWAGVELAQPVLDVGKDILYHTVQEGFNELLDSLFKEAEDKAMDAASTKVERHKWRKLLAKFEAEQLGQESKGGGVDGRKEAPSGGESSDSAEEHAEASVEGTAVDKPVSEPESAVMAAEEAPVEIDVHQTEMVEYASEQHRDPTMPQFRPDETSTGDIPKTRRKSSSAPPSEEILRRWLSHQQIEREARGRGGYGRLNYYEFVQRMIPEKKQSLVVTTEDTTKDGDDITRWESSADLGKLSFVGTWLEMASF